VLQRNGAEVEVDRACVEILATLLSHCGEVVTKDELLEVAWPGRIVSENSLTKAIGRLRATLGDLDVVSTVHGYGYRFAGKVRFQAHARAERRRETATIQPGDGVPSRASWTFTRQIGVGGCSEVWAARRADTCEQRAVKVATDESGLRALKREVALHRLMDGQPKADIGTVPLLGWNLTEPPFFVEMPLIEAGNLRQWLEQSDRSAAPTLEARLALMARVAANVARLHAMGIIHKDLKPENVLIQSREGVVEPLLTDFGAGWLCGNGAMNALLPISTTFADALRDSPRLASAHYAAPEVLRGEMPTTSADVYALGVMLYQMVVGDLTRPLGSDWEQDVQDEVLRSDIHDAATNDLSRRIASAQVLAERLRTLAQRRAALVENRQVQDRIASATQRMTRARERLRIAAAVGAVLTVGLLSTGYMYWRTEQARAEAVAQAHRAQAMLRFVTDDILSAGDPYGNHGDDVTIRDAVTQAAQRLDRRFGADPQALATMHLAIAKMYQGLGEYGPAIQHNKAAARVAGVRIDTQAQLAGILVDLTSEEVDADHLAEADSTLTRAAAAALLATEPGKALLAVSATRAELRFEQGRYREAHAAAEQVISAAPPPDHSPDDPLANAWWYAALSSEELGEFARSEQESELQNSRQVEWMLV
jgi:DNA-binding winged helix-turn-helix (wHTH) protein/tetratricopeptide (TPR) repeat protein